ncbi:MAG: hypothetical protein Q4E75_02345, partial [bacterium]|nr:hypothetical protein [bacterium]
GVELPQASTEPEQPQMPTFGVELPQASTEPELSPVPETMPIIDNPESGLSSGEYVSPKTEIQPIIITDYAKQFDPIMPSQEIPISKPDWKEVIKLIRDCSSKIEQYGFKIEVEEYDLVNLYQVIFKIDK